jgi:hypothetical protein
MVAETAQHAGHADIIRELLDAEAGPDHGAVGEVEWREYVGRVQAAADAFRPDGRTGIGAAESRRPLRRGGSSALSSQSS